jgi:hypothetical protein
MAIDNSLLGGGFGGAGATGSYGAPSQDEVMQQLLAQRGGKKPKAGFLERVFALPTALGSIPDAFYRSKYEGKGVLPTYLGNLGKAVRTTFTGKKREDELKELSDILQRQGMLAGQDFGSKAARFGLDLASSVLLDPTTYISFGTSAIGKTAAKELAEGVAKETGEKVSKELVEELAETTAKEAGEKLLPQLSDDASRVANELLGEIPVKRMAKLPGFGEVTNPVAVEGLSAITNPLGSAFRGAKAGAQKIAPQATDEVGKAFNTIFRPKANIKDPLRRKLYDDILDFTKTKQGKEIRSRVASAPLRQQLEELPDDVYRSFGEIMEGTAKREDDTLKTVLANALELSQQKELLERGLIDSTVGAVGGPGTNTATRRFDYLQDIMEEIGRKEGQETVEDLARMQQIKNLLPTQADKEGMVGILQDLVEEDLGMTGQEALEEVGEQALTYVPHRVIGYRDQFIRENLGSIADDILTDPRAIKDMDKFGEPIISKSTLGEILDDTAQKRPGMDLSPVRELMGAEKERTFKTLKAGKEAGVVYDEDWARVLTEGRERSEKAIASYDFAKNLKSADNPYSSLFYTAQDIKAPATRSVAGKHPKVKEVTESIANIKDSQQYQEALQNFRFLQSNANQSGQSLEMVAEAYGPDAEEALDTYMQLRNKLDDLELQHSEAIDNLMEGAEIQADGKILKKLRIPNTDITYFTDPDTYKMVKGYSDRFLTGEGLSKTLEGYDKALQAWKASVTGLGPGFIGFNIRNATGDFTNMLLDGFRVGKTGENMQTASKVLQFQKRALEDGLEVAREDFGDEIYDLWDKALDRGVITTQTQSTTQAGTRILEQLGRDQKEGIGRKAFGAWEDVATVGGLTEDRELLFRLAHFKDTLDRTGSVDEAAQAVRRTLFNYDELTSTESNVIKRIMPFYSFMKKNAEFHLQNLAKNPGRYSGMRHLLKSIRDNFGADMSDRDWAALPGWMKEGMSIALNKEGEDVNVLTNFGLPTEAFEEVMSGDVIKSGLSPALRIPIEQATGYDMFLDQPIDQNRSGTRYERLPGFAKDLLGYKETTRTNKAGEEYTYSQVNPRRAYAAANTPVLGPLLTQYKNISEAIEQPYPNLINLVSGGKVYGRNIEAERSRRQQEELQRLQEELYRQGIGNVYENYYIPAEIRKELL